MDSLIAREAGTIAEMNSLIAGEAGTIAEVDLDAVLVHPTASLWAARPDARSIGLARAKPHLRGAGRKEKRDFLLGRERRPLHVAARP
jgi:hypothetical protein